MTNPKANKPLSLEQIRADAKSMGIPATALMDMLAGTLRGATASTLGTPADIYNLANTISGDRLGNIPYDTDYFKSNLPPTIPGNDASRSHTAEFGEDFGTLAGADDIQMAKLVGKGVAKGAKIAGQEIADRVATGQKLMPGPFSEPQMAMHVVNPKLFSAVDKTASELPRAKGTGKEFMTELSKKPGVKKAELADRNLHEIQELPKMTKEQFLSELADRPAPQVTKKVLDEYSAKHRVEPFDSRSSLDRRHWVLNEDGEPITDYPYDTREDATRALSEVNSGVFHKNWKLPGGSNYQEHLYKYEPEGEDPFVANSNHFGGEPNVLASARTVDRKTPDGKKILHVEEIQSDWHQKGRERGYMDSAEAQEVENKSKQIAKQRRELVNELTKYEHEHGFISPEMQSRWNAFKEIEDEHKEKTREVNTRVPDAPFKKNWEEMVSKDLIKHAIDNGYDGIALTNGKDQADRYSLAQHVDEISHYPRTDAFTGEKSKSVRIDMKTGNPVQLGVNQEGIVDNVSNSEHENFKGKHISDIVGKEHAKNIMGDERGQISGEGLTFGGEGMKGFYDKKMPNIFNDIGKPYSAEMNINDLPVLNNGKHYANRTIEGDSFNVMDGNDNIISNHPTQQEANIKARELNSTPLHYMEFTPEMKQGVATEGLPAYKKGGKVYVADDADMMRHELMMQPVRRFKDGGQEGLLDKSIGAGEAALSAITNMFNPVIGGAVGLAKSIPESIKTGEAPAPIASREAEKYLKEHTGYQPRTEKGQEYIDELGKLMEDLHVPPVVGDLSFAHNVGEVTAPIKQLAKDYLKANPPSVGMSIKPIDNIEAAIKPEQRIKVKPKQVKEPEPTPHTEEQIAEHSFQPASTDEAQKHLSNGHYVYGLHEQAEEPHLLRSADEVNAYTPDQLAIVPKDIPIDDKPIELTPEQESAHKAIKEHVEANQPVEDIKEDAKSDDIKSVDGQKKIPEDVDSVSGLGNALNISKSKIWNKGRDLKQAMQDALKAKADEHGVDLSAESPETLEYLTRMAVKDGKEALDQNPNAVGWYDLKTRQALAVMSLIHPEIASDLDARNAFTWAMSVTSNGLKVDKNFELAEKAYEQYKKTGQMPTDIGIGQAKAAINDSLGLYNKLKEKWGPENLRKFMNSQFKVGEISAIDPSLKPGGEHADVDVQGASILGPKIGNGFFSNLNGKFDSLTMDRWLVRTWGRWSGTLLKDMPTQTAEARSRLSTAMKDILNNPEELDRMSQAIGKDITADLHPDELATAIQESSMDPGKRKQMNAFPAGEEMRKSGNSLAKYLDGQKEAPAGPTERKFIRQVFGNALDQLRNDPKYKDLTMADLQAVLWYAEKRLYESAKEDLRADDVVEGYADEEAPDYARAAVNVAKAKGIGDRKINNILKQEEQRGRSANARSPNVEEEGTVGGKQGETRGFTGDKERNTFIADQAVKRVRSNLNGTDGPSYAYQARSGGDGGGVRGLKDLGATYVNEWKLGPKASTIFRANNVPAPTFYELDASGGAKKGLSNAQIFANKITESKANNRFGSSVYVYSPEEYANMRLFLTKDGQTGVAVKPDGDIVSVFAPNNSKHLNGIMHLATSVGGNKLDAFDTVLPRLYSTHGFRPVSRTLWDDQFAPEGWDKSTFEKYKNGEPDVVFMAHDPSYMGQHEPGAGKVMTGNNAYTRAFNARDRHLKTIKERIPKMADGGSVAQPIHESFLNPSIRLANGSVTLNPLEFMPNYLKGGKVHVSDDIDMMRHELNTRG